ncbi:MAG: NAD(+) synthase [Flavobacteriaceae bacterium]|nr:NAD(+) synthase [Flavobacteriaceae bacterium]
MKSPEKVQKHIVKWLKEYLVNSKQNGFVIGISGGIDSALTSTLCALTKFPVYVIEMPIYQNINQVSRSRNHMNWLVSNYENVTPISHSLTKVFNAFKSEIEKTTQQELDLLSLANTRARLRMTALYYFAGSYKCLVVGTGNKVEDFGIGFYTKYGDGGVDLSPIADLLKSEVLSLASHLNILKSILSADPTDGLWDDGRTDEDQIGAKYEDLEKAMELIKNNISDNNLNKKQIKIRKIYQKLHSQNKHKMLSIPVCFIPKEYL